MNCEFEPRYEGRQPERVKVRCIYCGDEIETRTFPIRSECSMGPLQEFLNDPVKVENAKKRFGLGDVVAIGIKIATLGLVKPSKECGCAERREKLNDLFSIPVE